MWRAKMSKSQEPIHELSMAEREAQAPHMRIYRCKGCRRAIFKDEVDGVEIWRHWQPEIDFPGNVSFHFAELEDERLVTSELSTGWTRL
jgi:hypothetical protein